MPLNQVMIREILYSGDFAALVGEFESEQLECKRQPYLLGSDEQKLELSKDVAALANAAGGVILIGCATKKDPTHGEDQLEQIRPFEKSLLDPTRYQQILQDWLWPPLHGLEVQWFQSASDATKGIAAIFVPTAEGQNRPVLITKTIIDSSKKTEILFGYCERKKARVVSYSVQHLQVLLRDGSRLDGEIRDGLQSLHSVLEEIRGARSNEASRRHDPDEFNRRLEEALSAVGLNDESAFAIAAHPQRILDLGELFKSRETRLVQLLENPPKLRSSGFDLSVSKNSRIVEGRMRRVIIERYKLLELHRDGILIFVTRGDSEALCWGRERRQLNWRLINQLALIETTLLFCKFAIDVYKGHLEEKDEIDFDLKMLRMNKGPESCRLETGPLTRLFHGELYEAPKDSGSFFIGSNISKDPAEIALNLVAQVYAWFGLDEDKVPYAKSTTTGRVIDEEQLLRVG